MHFLLHEPSQVIVPIHVLVLFGQRSHRLFTHSTHVELFDPLMFGSSDVARGDEFAVVRLMVAWLQILFVLIFGSQVEVHH